ncbi:MAG: hypothetical protein AABZ08_04135 [Planctomycetota bacterium]
MTSETQVPPASVPKVPQWLRGFPQSERLWSLTLTPALFLREWGT